MKIRTVKEETLRALIDRLADRLEDDVVGAYGELDVMLQLQTTKTVIEICVEVLEFLRRFQLQPYPSWREDTHAVVDIFKSMPAGVRRQFPVTDVYLFILSRACDGLVKEAFPQPVASNVQQ